VTGIEPTTSGLLDQRRSRSDHQAPSMLIYLEGSSDMLICFWNMLAYHKCTHNQIQHKQLLVSYNRFTLQSVNFFKVAPSNLLYNVLNCPKKHKLFDWCVFKYNLQRINASTVKWFSLSHIFFIINRFPKSYWGRSFRSKTCQMWICMFFYITYTL